MSALKPKWLRGLQSSSLLRPPPQNANQKQTEVLKYVDIFAQFTSESFVDDIGELVRSHYPSQEDCLLDDVLAAFVLHHPEHGHAVLYALLSCVIDGTLIYEKKTSPFRSFISLFSPSNERDFSEQWAVACGETLRVLTHYNRPTFKVDGGRPSATHASPCTSGEASGKGIQEEDATTESRGRKLPTRLLTPWITDNLLAASTAIRNHYFRWCAGIIGKYAAQEELRPPTIVSQGKQPQLLPSTPRWAVANGAAVILSVCNDEVDRYESADLTASAVPALLIRPPPPTFEDEHLMVVGSPLEPYAQLFHRYYAIATAGATQRLLLGLLETPPSGAPHGLLLVVALVEILRATDNCNSSVQLRRDWLQIHFLKPAAAAMATGSGIVADAAAALLFHIFSQPALFVRPRPPYSHGISPTQSLYGCATLSSRTEEAKAAAALAIEDATAAGLAALMVSHGPDVESRICALWEAAFGLRPLGPPLLEHPKLILSTPLQPSALSWNLMRPLLRILEYLPTNCVTQESLRKIFIATVEAILQRTFPCEKLKQLNDGNQRVYQAGGLGVAGMAELRAMVHCLFTESILPSKLAAQLLADALTLCLSHDVERQVDQRETLRYGRRFQCIEGENPRSKEFHGPSGSEACKNRGAVATFNSYVIAAVCALACEVRLLSFSPAYQTISNTAESSGQVRSSGPQGGQRPSNGFPVGFATVVEHTKRLGLLEQLLTESPSFARTRPTDNTTKNEVSGESVVAAHMSALLGQSRACLHSLTEIMKCEWDPGICAQAAAVLALIENNGDMVHVTTHERGLHGRTNSLLLQNIKEYVVPTESDQVSPGKEALQKSTSNRCRGTNFPNGRRQKSPNGVVVRSHMGKQVVRLPLEATDVAALLCKDRRNGQTDVLAASLRPVIVEKQHLAISSVALLCQRLVSSPDMPNSVEGTSAERGWHQVVDALSNMAASLPDKVAPFIVTQAETQLQPWTSKDDIQSQRSVWRINIRIVSLLSALLRLRNIPYVVKVVVQDGSLLQRATDGLTIDREVCILPQLELLEAAAVAAQAASNWDEPHEGIADRLLSLLRERLPAIVRCLSHSSAHVRAMSMARLRDMLYFKSSRSCQAEAFDGDTSGNENLGDWRKAVEEGVAWEAHYRRAGGMSLASLATAAAALGCSVPSQCHY